VVVNLCRRRLKTDPLATVDHGPPPETMPRVEPGEEGRGVVPEDWAAEIRQLRRAEGVPIKQVLRVLG